MRRSLQRLLPVLPVSPPVHVVVEKGERGTRDWRIFLEEVDGGRVLSPWHDLPRQIAGADPRLVTFVNEIPRGTRAKMELLKEEAHNPIAQDILKKKEGKPLRFFTYGDMPFNYGFIPCTWENPEVVDTDTKCVGDGDPVDVVQLGPDVNVMGQCLPVRVLGVLALIDQGETDWKIVVEAVVPGREADGYGSIDKVPQEVKAAITDWFRNYKTTEGKPQNEFAFNGEIRGADDALRVIAECAAHYDALMQTDGSQHGYWLR